MPPATAHKKGQYAAQTVILTQDSVFVRQVNKYTFSFFMIFLPLFITIMSTKNNFAIMAVLKKTKKKTAVCE